jgi:hypothetical protein
MAVSKPNPLFQCDTSTARTLEEFIAALRRAEVEFADSEVTNPECSEMKTQYAAIRADRLQIADDLERLLQEIKRGK